MDACKTRCALDSLVDVAALHPEGDLGSGGADLER